MNKKFGQLMIIGIQGKSLSEDEKKFIINNNISGIILMGRNCESPKQVHDLCTEIQSLRFHMPDKAPLFIGIDNQKAPLILFNLFLFLQSFLVYCTSS